MPLVVMNVPQTTPEGEADYGAAMREYYTGPVPMCHFTPMTFHADDSDSGVDGYQCDHCGQTESSEEAWTKVEARRKGQD